MYRATLSHIRRACRQRHGLRRAFTLVEMLVVVSILGIVLVLIVPAMSQIMRGSNMTQSGELTGDLLTLARQTAITSNHRAQVRFYQLPVTSVGGTTSFCAMQTFRVEDSGLCTPLTSLRALRAGVIFAADNANPSHSTILVPPSGVSTVSGKDNLPAYGNQSCNYVGFQFLPDGSTDLDPTVNTAHGGWYITLVDANRAIPAGQPPNFYTLRVDPITGLAHPFRP